jgi:hypothetical protein
MSCSGAAPSGGTAPAGVSATGVSATGVSAASRSAGDESPLPACPFCEAPHTVLVSPFGCQHMTAQYRCSTCGSYFEAVREDR